MKIVQSNEFEDVIKGEKPTIVDFFCNVVWAMQNAFSNFRES